MVIIESLPLASFDLGYYIRVLRMILDGRFEDSPEPIISLGNCMAAIRDAEFTLLGHLTDSENKEFQRLLSQLELMHEAAIRLESKPRRLLGKLEDFEYRKLTRL